MRPATATLLAWARELGEERVWAIEDCRNLSGALEQLLLDAGERALRVPSKLMASERKKVRSFGKSDAIDALAVARAFLREPDLPEARPPGPERELRLLSDHREDLIGEGTRYQRRLRWHLHEIDPELAPALRGAAKKRNLDRLARQLARREQTAQVRICRELIRRIRELAKRVAELDRELADPGPRPAQRAAGDPGLRGHHRGPDPRRGRRRDAIRDRSAPRELRRRRAAGRLLGPSATPPPQPLRQPAAEPGDLHDRAHPDPHPPARPRLHGPSDRRRQDQPRSATRPQAPAHPHASTAS